MWDLFDFHGFFHVKTIFIFNFFSKAPEIRALVMKYLVIYLRPETHPGLNCETITLKVKISYKFWNVNVLWIISTYWVIIFSKANVYIIWRFLRLQDVRNCSCINRSTITIMKWWMGGFGALTHTSFNLFSSLSY